MALKRLAGIAAAILLPACLVLPLSSCWSNRPIGTLSLIIGIGFDRAVNGDVIVTVQAILPSRIGNGQASSGSDGSSDVTAQITAEGKTSNEAARNLMARLNYPPYWAHVQLVVLGEKAAREGLSDIWDMMERNNEFSRTMSVVVAKGGTAQEVLNATSKLNKLSALQIVGTLSNDEFYGKSVNIKSYKVTEEMSEPNDGIVTGVIEANDTGTLENMPIQGAAVFKHGKLCGYLSPEETRGYLYATDDLEGAAFAVDKPGNSGEYVTLKLIAGTHKMDAKLENGKPVFSISVHLLGAIGDEQGSGNLINWKDIGLLQDEAIQSVRADIQAALDASQSRLDADIFQFNRTVYATQPAEYKKVKDQWSTLYQQARVEVKSNYVIQTSGLIRQPAYAP